MDEILVDRSELIAVAEHVDLNCPRMRTSAAVPAGARLSRRNNS